MSNQELLLKEYEIIRLEIIERAKLLHQLISLSVILSSTLFIVAFWLFPSFSLQQKDSFLLGLPLLFAGLTFNYQANQMTLESLAGYSRELVKTSPPIQTWDDFYGKYKYHYQLTSFLKTLPLLVPQLVPYFFFVPLSQTSLGKVLLSVDIVFFLLVLVNFRYKMHRY
jgi:hypothetical protein